MKTPMKIIPLLLLAGLISACNSTAKKEVVENESAIEEEAAEMNNELAQCLYYPQGASIDTTYPYNVSDKIELVSFDDTLYDNMTSEEMQEAEEEWSPNNVRIKNGKFEIKCLLERIKINKIQTDSAFSILFKRKPTAGIYEASPCYSPRHAMLFYKKGKALAFLEICFECKQTRRDKEWKGGVFCDNTWLMLQDYFKWAGIKKGFGE